MAGGVRVTLPDYSDLQARIFTDFETFHSNFLAVPAANPARSIGRMTLLQEVPTTGVGGMVQWSKAFSTRYLFSAGGDFRHVDGASNEQGLDATQGLTVTLLRESGGTQLISGGFVQGQVWLQPNLSVTLSARVDNWQNTDGRNLETTAATGLPTANNRTLPDTSDTAVSPRAAVLYRVSDRVSAFGSIGSGFRAPTLNELYRQFRVGTILTLANDQLGPERLMGGELGISVAPIDGPDVSQQLVRQPRREPGGQRDSDRSHRRRALHRLRRAGHHLPAAPEPRADAHRRLAERRRVPRGARLARGRRLPVQLRRR